MSIQDEQELLSLRVVGRIVRKVLDAMKAEVRAGVTTRYLDEIGARVMQENGARSAPSMVYQFPGASCISLNDEAVHGVPGERALEEGDLVKLDVTVEKDGYMADAAITVPVGRVSLQAEQLMACAERAFHQAMLVARAGFRVLEIGKIVEREVHRCGFAVVRELGGHGIGRTIHESPHVPNYPDPEAGQVMNEGLVITVEPIISSGSGRVFTDKDGWTVRTRDHALSAHFEHTLVITSGPPILLTAG
ncbi:MAG TPA: type I methionyl aminopeptidase [Terriglobales bacterium]|nr:type I methionyl aminopeptidase [Terriglobales bacterium]